MRGRVLLAGSVLAAIVVTVLTTPSVLVVTVQLMAGGRARASSGPRSD
jgi:hypothetical protein